MTGAPAAQVGGAPALSPMWPTPEGIDDRRATEAWGGGVTQRRCGQRPKASMTGARHTRETEEIEVFKPWPTPEGIDDRRARLGHADASGLAVANARRHR